MPVEVEGFYEGHNVSVDSVTDWPLVHMTCICGWTSTVDADADGLKDAVARVWIHTGGPAREGSSLVDENLLNLVIDQQLTEIIDTS